MTIPSREDSRACRCGSLQTEPCHESPQRRHLFPITTPSTVHMKLIDLARETLNRLLEARLDIGKNRVCFVHVLHIFMLPGNDQLSMDELKSVRRISLNPPMGWGWWRDWF